LVKWNFYFNHWNFNQKNRRALARRRSKIGGGPPKNFGAPGGALPPILNHTFAAVMSASRGFGD
jgi:hypothetical protein